MTSTRTRTGTEAIARWPEESREAAKRIVATDTFFEHRFPAPHIDAVESFIDYRVLTDADLEKAVEEGKRSS